MSDLVKEIERCYADPLRFVRLAYPWGEEGALKREVGPEPWQERILVEVGKRVKANRFNGKKAVAPVRVSVSSGHGVGKSALVSWLIHWLMSTRPHCRGTVTATTANQLRARTWSELARWTNLLICRDWFGYHNSHANMSFEHVANPDTWATVALTCREENSEAFAGQHASSSSSFYLVDEASGVPAKIYEVMEGGLTDGEPFIFLFGNPTRNEGYFFQTHNVDRERWIREVVDSREVSRTNKEQIEEWVNLYGEDSDFVRVRVRGVFPRRSSQQLIGTEAVEEAMLRVLTDREIAHSPRVLGVDVARYGDNESVIARRQGCQVLELQRFSGLAIMELTGAVVHQIQTFKPHAVFVDEVGMGSGVVDRLNELGYSAIGVSSGSRASDPRFYNKRAECWGLMAEWVETASLPRDAALAQDLTGPEYGYDSQGRLKLETKDQMRARGMASPDAGDALAFTFAYPVASPGNTLEGQYLELVGAMGTSRAMGPVQSMCKTHYDLWRR